MAKNTSNSLEPRPGKGGGITGQAEKVKSEIFSAADVMLEKAELAVKLKVHVRTIENWQRDGFLPYIKIGNAVWFYWPDVIQHLLKNFRVLAPLAGVIGTGNMPVGNGGAQ